MDQFKVQIQLTNTQSGYLDLKEEADIPLNYSVAEIRDITARKGTFSKTIKLAGSKNNAKLLNHYFDVNVQAGTFDINKLQPCTVLVNSIPVIQNGLLQLVAVKKFQTNNRHDHHVEYEVLVKDILSDFFTKLGSSELQDLFLGYRGHTYSASNVVASWSHNSDDVYRYTLPFNDSDNEYRLEEFTPAIYAKAYWDKIFSTAGFTYEWPGLTASDVQFDKLVIPANGQLPTLTAEDLLKYRVEASNASASNWSTSDPGTRGYINSGTNTFLPAYLNPVTLANFTELLDPNNSFNPTTGVYTVPFNTNSLEFSINASYEIEVYNPLAGSVNLVNGKLGFRPIVQIGTTAKPVLSFIAGGETTLDSTTLFSSGWNSLSSGNFQSTVNIPEALVSGNTLTAKLSLQVKQLFNISAGFFVDGSNVPVAGMQARVRLTSINFFRLRPSTDSFGFGQTVDLQRFIPAKVKQADFIKSICTMFNLFLDVDPQSPNKFIIKTRDDYYDSGKEKDWTLKLNKNREQDIKFLPELQEKRLILSYKNDDSDKILSDYFNATKEVYGQQEFVFDNEYIKGLTTKELIFSSTPFAQTQFGAYASTIFSDPKNNLRILYAGATYSCSEWKILDYGTTVGATVSYYPWTGHFDNPTLPAYDINFGVCDFYYHGNDTWTDQLPTTNNNLYNLHWRRTLNQINTSKLLTAYFNLSPVDINTLRLNDKIRIDNSWWNINKIVDYNPNKPGPTKVELISLDNESKLVPFKTRRPRIISNSDKAFDSVRDQGKVRDLVTSNGGRTGTKDGIITGQGNQLPTSLKGIVIGDKNVAIGGNIQIIGSDNTTLGNAFIIGDNNEVGVGFSDVYIFGSGLTATQSNALYVQNLQVPGQINNVEVSKITDLASQFATYDSGTISSATILALNNFPLQLLPAPGTNKAYEILSATLKFNYVSSFYSGNTTLAITQGGTINAFELNCLGRTSNGLFYFNRVNSTSQTEDNNLSNTAVNLTVKTGNPAGAGTSTIQVYLTYRIIDL